MADKSEVPRPTSGTEQRPFSPRPPLGRDGDVFRHAGHALALAGVHRDSPQARSLRESYGLTSQRDREVATQLFYRNDGQPLGAERTELLGEAFARLGDRGVKIEALPGRAIVDLVYKEADLIEAERAARYSLGEVTRQKSPPLEPVAPRIESSIVPTPQLSRSIDPYPNISGPKDNPLVGQLRGLTSNDMVELTGSKDLGVHDKVRKAKSTEELEEMGIDLDKLSSLAQRNEQAFKDLFKRK